MCFTNIWMNDDFVFFFFLMISRSEVRLIENFWRFEKKSFFEIPIWVRPFWLFKNRDGIFPPPAYYKIFFWRHIFWNNNIWDWFLFWKLLIFQNHSVMQNQKFEKQIFWKLNLMLRKLFFWKLNQMLENYIKKYVSGCQI